MIYCEPDRPAYDPIYRPVIMVELVKGCAKDGLCWNCETPQIPYMLDCVNCGVPYVLGEEPLGSHQTTPIVF
jgi:hypothetical protein